MATKLSGWQHFLLTILIKFVSVITDQIFFSQDPAILNLLRHKAACIKLYTSIIIQTRFCENIFSSIVLNLLNAFAAVIDTYLAWPLKKNSIVISRLTSRGYTREVKLCAIIFVELHMHNSCTVITHTMGWSACFTWYSI